MDRLTREEIAGAVARGYCTTANMHKELDADLVTAITNEVMALFQSLSQEAVRDEALEEAAKIAEPKSGDPQNDWERGYWAAENTISRDIRALKREPNVAGPDHESPKDAICAEPAPAEPDVAHDWIERADDPGVYDCANCTSWTANLPLYKDEVCDAKERRFTDRRKARSLR